MRILAPFRGQVASGKDRGRPVAETLSALMNCGLKIIKNRLHSGRILGSYGFGTKFQVRSSSRRARKLIETIQLSKYDSLLDITIQEGIPYPACRRGVAAAEFAAKPQTPVGGSSSKLVEVRPGLGVTGLSEQQAGLKPVWKPNFFVVSRGWQVQGDKVGYAFPLRGSDPL